MKGHGGNIWQLSRSAGCRPKDLLDFSANINPLGAPAGLRQVLLDCLDLLHHYPDPDNSEALAALADHTGLKPGNLVIGNGTSELLFHCVAALPCQRAVLPVPAYIDYKAACLRAGLEVHLHVLEPSREFRVDFLALEQDLAPGDLVLLGQPNNPTGVLNPRQNLLEFCQRHHDCWFIIDEAFAGFITHYSSVAGLLPNIIVLNSLTKLYAIPGLRLGFLSGPDTVCAHIRQRLSPWSVNTLAQAAVPVCLADHDFQHQSQQVVAENRQFLARELAQMEEFTVFPSAVNYLLLRYQSDNLSSDQLVDTLRQRHRILIRPCGNYDGLDDGYLRVAVKSASHNERLIAALADCLGKPRASGRARNEKKPALMLLGTGSDVGKSVLNAGLCRIFVQDGYQPRPFKAQNMSLNSYVTRDGGEMGRAQVVQAQACRLEPDVRMNPVLLKPCTDVGSQVIVLGQPVGNMEVATYFRYKEKLWQQVCQTYDELAAEADLMVLEGAGSPGEVNLMHHDIVNLKMARYAKAPALLVGDIDRGGVYASFIGHFEVLAPEDRGLIAGFVVNRFRGDKRFLADAHAYVQARTGKPVLGAVDYLDNLDLPQEDSVNFRAGIYDRPRPDGECLDIALIDLPHISNFTDIEALLQEPDVWLHRVRRPEELAAPDAVILPGSKNVLADLAFLRQSGLAERIVQLAGKGCEIIGVCGGYQILGKAIQDPHGIEGPAGQQAAGLGLLDITTALETNKQLVRRQGLHLGSGCPVTGYEIHHGISRGGAQPLVRFDDGGGCGAATSDQRVWGCYLHGIFDSDPFRHHLLERMRLRKGLAPFAGQRTIYDLEPALDRLADHLRTCLDMAAIYRLLGL